jgi:hypothetical protein
VPRDNNDYSSRGYGKRGLHPAVRTTSFRDTRRGGYQGPDTRGQIRGQIGRAGGGQKGPAGNYGNRDYRR